MRLISCHFLINSINLEKYITINEIPRIGSNPNKTLNWWIFEHMPEIIEILENNNPCYEFLQVVTSPGHGWHKEYVIMKIKNDTWARLK